MTGPTPLQVLGVELALLGSFVALAFGGVDPRVVLLFYLVATLAAFVIRPGVRRPFWGSVGLASRALLPSFLAVVPGALFYLESVKWQHRDLPRFCYDLPMNGWGTLWLLVGPVLLFIGARASAWRTSKGTVVVLHGTHAIAWLVATGNAWLCSMTV